MMTLKTVRLVPRRQQDQSADLDPTVRSISRPGSVRDHQLAAEFLDGESSAITRIAGWIRQAASRHRGRLPRDWDDLQQDLLLEVMVVLRDGGFRGESTLRTFVWRIVHYRCLNRIRDLSRRPESELGEQALRLPDPTRPVLERLVERESEDLLQRFLGTVTGDCCHLWQALLAGQSYREISHQTDLSEGALRVRVLRCRRKALALWKTWLDLPSGSSANSSGSSRKRR